MKKFAKSRDEVMSSVHHQILYLQEVLISCSRINPMKKNTDSLTADKIDYTWQPQAGAGPSNTTATEQLRNLICRVGESTDEITEKSVKMGWVT